MLCPGHELSPEKLITPDAAIRLNVNLHIRLFLGVNPKHVMNRTSFQNTPKIKFAIFYFLFLFRPGRCFLWWMNNGSNGLKSSVDKTPVLKRACPLKRAFGENCPFFARFFCDFGHVERWLLCTNQTIKRTIKRHQWWSEQQKYKRPFFSS